VGQARHGSVVTEIPELVQLAEGLRGEPAAELEEELDEHGDEQDEADLLHAAYYCGDGDGRAHEEEERVAGEDLGGVTVEAVERDEGGEEGDEDDEGLDVAEGEGEDDERRGHNDAQAAAQAIWPFSKYVIKLANFDRD